MRVKSKNFGFGVGILFTLIVAVACDSQKQVSYSRAYQSAGATPVDGACTSNEECMGYPETTVCNDTKVCSCNNEHVKVENSEREKTCEPIRNEIGQECVDAKQCIAGILGELSDCIIPVGAPESGKSCQCKEEAIKGDDQDRKCYQKREKIGEKCEANSQCSYNMGPDSMCIQPGGVCDCIPGQGVPANRGSDEGDKCLPIRQELGMECETREQCTLGLPGVHSDCLYDDKDENMKCHCLDGDGLPNLNLTTCLEIKSGIGEPCAENEECRVNLGILAECRSGKCECQEKLSVPNNANNYCLAVINQLGGSCTERQQCTEGAPGEYSGCLNNKCSCMATAVPEVSTNICHPKRYFVEEECKIQDQCTANIGNLTECNSLGRCNCKLGAVPNLEDPKGSQCLPGGLKISEACLDKAQCPGLPDVTSTCRPFPDRFCGCWTGYTPSILLNDCLPIMNKIGDSCEEANQCQKGLLGDMSGCFENICNCTEEAINAPDDALCRKRATIIGDVCRTHAQCEANLENSACQAGNCVCFPNTVESTKRDKCLEVKNLGETCVDINQCSHMQHVECLSYCRCVEGYATHPYVTNTCMKLASLIGDSCAVDATQCRELQEGGVFCNVTTDLCECTTEKPVVSLNKTKCLEKVDDLEGICEESQQCQVEGSLCTGGQCTCNNASYIKWNEECLPIRTNVSETCQEEIQCSCIGQSSTVKCIEGKCQCPDSSRYSQQFGRCINALVLGQPCQFHDECQFGVNNLTFCIAPGSSDVRRCSCSNQGFQWGGSCWLQKYVGDPCGKSEECGMALEGPASDNRGMECVSGICTCKQGLVQDSSDWACSSARFTGVNLIIILISMSINSIFN